MKYIKLNNGIEMPQVGLGTFLIPNNILPSVLKEAYNLGYRQFDTAWRYYNEDVIGLTFRDLQRGGKYRGLLYYHQS